MYTPPNTTSTNMISITDSGVNIHLAGKATPTIAPVIMDNEIKVRLPDVITMESTHIEKLQLPGIIKLARQIQFPPKMHTSPLISFGVLCDDVCTITLYKQAMSIHKNG